MAMMLELEDARGQRTRHRLDVLPAALGRSCANDVVLDDPYVDAHHARVELDASGTLVLVDLESLNGIVSGGARTRRVALEPGGEVRLGRTTLRLRDPQEMLPPALLDRLTDAELTDAVPARSWPWRLIDAPLVPARRRVRALVVAAAVASLMLYVWLHGYGRSSAGAVLGAAVGFLVLGALWAGIWAVASRAAVQRFQFAGHFTVVSGITVAGLVQYVAKDWAEFFAPDALAAAVFFEAAGIVVLAAAVAAHLSLSSTMAPWRRWRAGAIVSIVLVALGGLVALAEDEGFTDVPSFSAVLKPVPAALIPTSTVDDFGEVMQDLREQVDALVDRP